VGPSAAIGRAGFRWSTVTSWCGADRRGCIITAFYPSKIQVTCQDRVG
jgi:hypothetical protein